MQGKKDLTCEEGQESSKSEVETAGKHFDPDIAPHIGTQQTKWVLGKR